MQAAKCHLRSTATELNSAIAATGGLMLFYVWPEFLSTFSGERE
jgi:hypothetical protein